MHRTKPVTTGHHITLRYLGTSTQEQLEAIQQACAIIEAQETPFLLRISRFVSYFRHSHDYRDRWIWAGVSGDTLALQKARDAIDAAADAAGYPPAIFPLTPHITVATVRSHIHAVHDLNPACRNLGRSIIPFEWTVEHIRLMVKSPEQPAWQPYRSLSRANP